MSTHTRHRQNLFAAAIGITLAALTAPAFAGQPAIAAASKSVAVDGDLEVLVEDYADGRSVTRHYLNTRQGRVELHFKGKAPALNSGTRIRVSGNAMGNAASGKAVVGNAVVLDAATADGVQILAAPLPFTMGEQRIAVILVNFQDDPGQPVTPDAARTMMFSTTNNYYKEASFGQTWLTGDVFGYYTIAQSDTACDADTTARLADQAATAAGVNLANYARKVYVFPKNACGWAGLGSVGGRTSRAWINASMNLLVVGHELGHNLGLLHAQSLDCDISALGNTCTTSEYGDTADMMGNYRAAHFSPFAKELLGWLNDGISPPIHTAASTGRYSIEPYSSASVGPKAIKIPRGVDGRGRKLWYYLEYRQPIGADAVLANTGNLTRGLVVRLATEGERASSQQIDMTPNSNANTRAELADGALEVNRVYTDSVANVSFSLVSADANGASVDVTVGGTPPVNTPPVANFSSTATGLTVQFNDSSTDTDGSIASRSWDFGDGGTSTATNPSRTYASAGIYTVTLTVTDNNGASHTRTATVTVTAPSNGTVLQNGVPVSGLSGAANSWSATYTLVVPAGATNLTIRTAGGSGDADLYVRLGSAPTTTSFSCRSWRQTNSETCTWAAPAAGTYHVRVRGYAAYSGLTLTPSFTP